MNRRYYSLSILVLVTLVFILLYTWKLSISQDLDSTLLPIMDILAHPEKYPLNIDISGNIDVKEPDVNLNLTLTKYSEPWIEVRPNVFVHSAYEDQRSKPNHTVVNIIALVKQETLPNLKLRCNVKEYSAGVNSSYASSYILHEQHNSTYVDTIFYCFISGVSPPMEVSLTDDYEEHNSYIHWLKVNPITKSPNDSSINICVKPMYGKANNILDLAEFLGFYSTLGVKTFTFYDYDLAEKTLSYLESTVGEDLNIRVVDWKLPEHVARYTWQYGQVGSIQDCIQRSRDHAFSLLVDLDEYLVPRQHYTLTELMKGLTDRTKRKIGSYVFRHSYFCERDVKPVVRNKIHLHISEWLLRETVVWASRNRSKVMVRSEAVAEGGIHSVRKHWKDWKPAVVPWELAMIHHYSEDGCKHIRNTVVGDNISEDRTAESFKIDVLFSKPMVKFRMLNGD